MAAITGAMVALVMAGIVMGIRALRRPPAATERDALLSTLRARPWDPRDALWLANGVLLSFAASLFIATWLRPRLADMSTHGILWITLCQAMGLELLILATVALLARRKPLPWRQLFGLDRYSLKDTITTGLRFYLYSVPIVAGAVLLNHGLLTALDIDVTPQPIIQLLLDETTPMWGVCAFTLIAAASAPIVEEALFRGLLLPLGLQGSTPLVTVVLVSALFALVHFHPAATLPLFAFGACLGVGMLRSGSAGVTAVMHAAFNTVNIIVMLTYALVSP
jgi:membrane protease YdiL (CAAX protease family)